MKSTFIKLTILFWAINILLFVSCSENKKEAETEDRDHAEHASGSSAEASEPEFQVDTAFQKQIGRLFVSYVDLKDAFVSSDVEKVKTEASATSQVLNNVDMKLLSGAAHNDWMNFLSGIGHSLQVIRSSNDIEEQRKAFSVLSDAMYKSVKAFGLGGGRAYYEFCPMAFNNEGAYWLSDSETIRNPYFGDKMLTCGSVREKLK